MCGISGLLRKRGSVEEHHLTSSASAMAHRGPDGGGVYINPGGTVGLAHRRLAIIDVSEGGAQPMGLKEGTDEIVLVFNGEIYNYRELRATCEQVWQATRGVRLAWRGTSDTEVLLYMYALFGEDSFARLNGIFTVGIWDARQSVLVVARDQMGVKPLYYANTSDGFAFASELKGLLRLLPLTKAVDEIAFEQYVTFMYTPGGRTLLRDVRKLEPGMCLVVQRDGSVRERCFFFSPFLDAEDVDMSAKDAIEGVRRHLREAVRRQMVADVPVGAFLSGGLDSSAVVAIARDYCDRRLQCFTFDAGEDGMRGEGWNPDLPFARKVAQHLDVDLHVVRLDQTLAESLSWVVSQLDEPSADPAALNTYLICAAARRQGIKVILSGAGGDDIFTGYRRHRAVDLEKWWGWLPVGVRRLMRRASDAIGVQTPMRRRLAKVLAHADMPPDVRMVSYFQWLSSGLLEMVRSDTHSASRNETAAPFFQYLARSDPRSTALNKILALETRFFLVDHNLHYTDKMSMAASVEVRVPYLDLDLVDFASRIPARLKQHGAIGKYVLKEAMAGVLPKEIIHRSKTGFGLPLRRLINDDLRNMVDETLSSGSLARRGFANQKGIEQLLRMQKAGVVDASYPIFALVCVELWCRNYLDA